MAGSTSGYNLEGGVHLNLSEVEKVRSLLSKLEKPRCTCSLTCQGTFLLSFPFGNSPFSFELNASNIPFKQ